MCKIEKSNTEKRQKRSEEVKNLALLLSYGGGKKITWYNLYMGYTQVSDLAPPFWVVQRGRCTSYSYPSFVRNGNYRRYGAPAVPLMLGIDNVQVLMLTNLSYVMQESPFVRLLAIAIHNHGNCHPSLRQLPSTITATANNRMRRLSYIVTKGFLHHHAWVSLRC